jgi:mRNA interferase RelE/StbE
MYKVQYHRLVVEKDFKHVPKADINQILKAVHKKLTLDPVAFGKPLASELLGYFRLRVGMYRLIYRVSEVEVMVFVLKVGIRKDFIVYQEAAKRLG